MKKFILLILILILTSCSDSTDSGGTSGGSGELTPTESVQVAAYWNCVARGGTYCGSSTTVLINEEVQ